MPRSGWLATGAVVSSLVLGTLESVGSRWPAVAGVLAIAALASSPWWPARLRLRGRVATLGVAVIALRLIVAAPAESGATAPALDGRGPWTFAVESIGSPRDGHQVATLRGDTGDAAARGIRVAATVPPYPALEPGDVVSVSGRPRPRPDSPYGRYLARIDAWGTLDVDRLTIVPSEPGIGRSLERLRRGAGDALAAVLPEPEAGLAAGILIGLRDRVDRTVAADFTTAGVSHVVAISGWNISIVGAAVAAVAGRIGRRRRSIVTAVAIVAYIAFAGASASVLRAGAMAGAVLLAPESGRSGRAAAALGWAVSILLVVDPHLVSDAGFQLSSLATAGLIAWATPMTGWLDRATRGHLPTWLTENLGVSLAAQAATLPLILVAFGRLALVAPAVNLVVVPIVAPAMAVGVVAMIGGVIVQLGAPAALGAILAAPGWVALRVMIGLVEVGASVPFASLSFGPIQATVLAMATCVAAVVIGWWRRHRAPRPMVATTSLALFSPTSKDVPHRTALRRMSAVLVVVVTVTAAVVVTRPGGVARVVVLDVGQGDAILVEGSHGGRLLIDGGPDPDRLLIQLDRHVPPWDRRLDVLVLSHPHEDHVAGLARLLDRYRVGRVFEPGMHGPGPGYVAWVDRLARPGAPADGTLAAGDALRVDEIDLRVLWPIRGRVPREPPDGGTGINNVSIVLLGTIDRRRFLLAGDVEQDIDPMLLATGLPRLDLLKVAHHGSRTATTQAFVDAVRPKIAIASAGAGNPYGHPAKSTLDRLAAAGARVLRTDQDGTVSVSFEATATSVQTEPRRRSALDPSIATAVAGPVAFGCRIARPVTAAVRASARATPARRPTQGPDRSSRLGYHRLDDGPRVGARGCPALLPEPPTRLRRARMRPRIAPAIP